MSSYPRPVDMASWRQDYRYLAPLFKRRHAMDENAHDMTQPIPCTIAVGERSNTSSGTKKSAMSRVDPSC